MQLFHAEACVLVHEACVEQAFAASEHLVYGLGLAFLNYQPQRALQRGCALAVVAANGIGLSAPESSALSLLHFSLL